MFKIREDKKFEVFRIVIQCMRDTCDAIGEKCIHINGRSLAFSDSAKRQERPS